MRTTFQLIHTNTCKSENNKFQFKIKYTVLMFLFYEKTYNVFVFSKDKHDKN